MNTFKLFFVSVALLAATTVFAQNSGETGPLEWEVVGTSLYISGNGNMPDYTYGQTPWHHLRTDITSIMIESGVRSVGNWAFYGFMSVMAVSLPNTVNVIGNYAFNSNELLMSINLPDAVTSIGAGAFGWCVSLREINIGSSVTSIGRGAFFTCEILAAINVADDNPNYSSENGILFNKDKTTLIMYPNGKAGTIYAIPTSVTETSVGAFANNLNLTSVTIPNSVTVLGKESFNSCVSLTNVNIPNSVTSIDTFTFMNCISLEEITIPSSVTSIHQAAFAQNPALEKVTNLAATPQPISNLDVFYQVPVQVCTLYVPAASLELYRTADVWKDFGTITAIVDFIDVTGVTVNPTELSLNQGESQTITANVVPSNATDQSVTFYSSNSNIAAVTRTGLVLGVSQGTTTITITSVDGGFTATCTVTVTGESGIADILAGQISIYPNPVKDELNIESGELNIKNVEIMDLSGKTVSTFNYSENGINISSLPEGIYFIKIGTDKGVVTKKFVKE